MQVKVLEQELEKIGGQAPQSQDLIELAKQEERRQEELQEAKEAEEVANLESQPSEETK